MATGSISQTARKLGRTQPAISLAIKNLENSLDVLLFERRGRQLVPVPEAHYLLAEATEILDRVTKLSGTMNSLRDTSAGSLNVAAMPGPSAFIFPRFISQSVAGNSDIQITFSSRSSAQIRELASTQNIDFGFADFDDPVKKSPQYLSEIISADCFCALPKKYPIASRPEVSIPDLDGLPMGMLHGNHPLPRTLASDFDASDAHLNIVVSSQFFLPLMPFISNGHCCSVIDPLTMMTEKNLNTGQGQIVFRPMTPPVRYQYAILSPLHRPLSRLAQKVKEEWVSALFDILLQAGSNPKVHQAPDMDASAP